MKMMQKVGSAALAALILGALALPPAEAVYKPKQPGKMSGQYMKDVRSVVSYLKTLPRPQRWLFIAERMGFLFMPQNGASGHDTQRDGQLISGSHFIGANGQEYDAKAELKGVPSMEVWSQNASSTERLGRDAVFSKFANEVTTLALENAKYQLEKMAEEQPVVRDMYLAYLARLCYLPDGTNPYKKPEIQNGPHNNPIEFYNIRNKGCKFIDLEGEEHNFDDEYTAYTARGNARWTILNVCAHHIGRNDILDLFPKDVKKLRANYNKKMQELTGGAADQPPAESENAKEVQPESTPKEPQILYRPKTNKANADEAYKNDMQKVVTYLVSIPSPLRWFFITERMGLMFMPPDGACGYIESNGWRKRGTHYVGADGQEYDCNAEYRTCPNPSAWVSFSNVTARLGCDEVFSELPEEVATIVLQTAMYHLKKMSEEQPELRDLYLAYLAGLCYMPDGKSPYDKEETITAPHKKPIMVTPLNSKCKFIDSAGKEQEYEAVAQKHERLRDDRWMSLNVCAYHIGKDAILTLFPKEVKAMRSHYERKMKKQKK